jgi:hypothetical protein
MEFNPFTPGSSIVPDSTKNSASLSVDDVCDDLDEHIPKDLDIGLGKKIRKRFNFYQYVDIVSDMTQASKTAINEIYDFLKKEGAVTATSFSYFLLHLFIQFSTTVVKTYRVIIFLLRYRISCQTIKIILLQHPQMIL